ncbi:hypothetical protein NHX12_001505, partial [Muraenolepis orangiensis]
MQGTGETRVSSSNPFALGSPRKDRGFEFFTTNMKSAEEDAYSYTPNVSLSLPLGMGNPCLATQYHTLQPSPVISVSSCHLQGGYGLQNEHHVAGGYYRPQGFRPNGAPPLESPRIEITAYSPFPEEEAEENNNLDLVAKRGVNSVVTLTLPNGEGYRDHSCLSPASSVSSRSCNSDASSYESGFYNYENSPQNSPWQSPCVSPKGSPALLSIQAQFPFLLNMVDESWLATNTNQYTNSAIVAAINALTTDGVVDMGEGIPVKARKTMLDHSPGVGMKLEPRGEDLGPDREFCHEDYASRMAFKKESYCGGFLDVPKHPYSWSKPKPYLSPSLPSLDWQLPSCSSPYSLQIELQPKSHHRAHYETEGSRGAVKALSGGHPVVQAGVTVLLKASVAFSETRM